MKLRDGFALVSMLFMALFGATGFAAEHKILVCVGAKIYPSPTAPPIEDAVLIVTDGKISTIAARGHAKDDVPGSALKLDCSGKIVVAGFWNSHVHFESEWNNAATAPAAKLESQMQAMLTRWGFTTVWDLGSVPDNTLALRRRVEAGEVAGPRILMAGAIFPKNGHPVYLPAEMQLPEAASPQQAEQMAQRYMAMGLDGVKLFTGVYMGDKPVINMDLSMVKVAVNVAHAQGKPVFAHPQNSTGVDNALNGGVDILAHTVPSEAGLSAEELAQMKWQHTALIPTLTLWTTVTQNPAVAEKLVQAGADQVKSYLSMGGTILFGTDVGFTSNYDTTLEFSSMGRAMDWREILASLTTNPSAYFKAATKGRIEKGMDADLVVLDADPAADVRNLAKVAYTIRVGEILYRK